MARTSETESTINLVLFFDANLPKIRKCRPGCKGASHIICQHSFGFNATFLHTSEYADFLRFSDFQVILHCVFLILHNKKYQRAAESRRFIIVTKDQKFLQDAEKVWQEKAKPKTRPKLIFGRESWVSWNGFVIFVKTIGCKNYGTNRKDDARCLVEQLNKHFAECP